MGRLALVGFVLFIVVMVLPELRTLMLVGGVGVMIGVMVGMQHASKHTAELHANRVERMAERASMRTVEA